VIVLDTGPVWAALDTTDAHHDRCAAFFQNVKEPLVLPAAVIGQVCYGLCGAVGPQAEADFLRRISEGAFWVDDAVPDDYERAAVLVEQYADRSIGYVDAMVVATAERLGARRVATLDHRDFLMIRPRHVEAFELLP
jgi:uncharacterized protein